MGAEPGTRYRIAGGRAKTKTGSRESGKQRHVQNVYNHIDQKAGGRRKAEKKANVPVKKKQINGTHAKIQILNSVFSLL